MPHFKDKKQYLKWVKERKSKKPSAGAGEKFSFLKFYRASSLAILVHNKWFLVIFFGFIGLGLFLWAPLDSPQKNKAIQKAAVPAMAAKMNNPTSESSSPRVRPAHFQSKDSPPSLDEIIARAKRTVFFLKTPQGSGAGFLLSSDGILVTQTRIIGRNDEVEVLIPSRGIKKGVVLKKLTDPLDLAFLKVEKFDLEDEPLPHSLLCKEGEEIMALGFPLGEKSGEPTLTTGIIRNCNSSHQGVRYLQLDQALAPANMGGPMINHKGELIGIFKGKLPLKGQEEMNAGLPIQMVRAVMEDKLVHLEERIKEREKFFKYIYDDFSALASTEYERYQKNVTLLHTEGKLSAQEAYRAEKIPLNPPPGFSSLKTWISDLTERVMNGEITKEGAVTLIKGHFDSSSLEKSI